MENQEIVPAPQPGKSQDQMIAEIHQFTKQTRNYMRWQMYVIVVLVVIPLLALLFILPLAFKSLQSAYMAPMQGLQ